MLHELDRKDRLRLMKFVCSFAWADLEVRDEERSFVRAILERLDLDAEERRMVEEWLDVPPRPEEIDPTQIPLEHRELFREAARGVVLSDGYVHPDERVNLELFDALLK